VASQPHLW